MDSQLYIGIMSGTSADGIDAALVEFSHDQITLKHSLFHPFTADIHANITKLYTPGTNEIDLLGELDVTLGKLYRNTVSALLKEAQLSTSAISGVGLHGQTIRHRPGFTNPFTLQIGNPYFISQELKIPVVNDFRRADMAMGGQGAPLAPLFHQALFGCDEKKRAVINIGGIANITYLQPGETPQGFDTGPGNGLMDDWIKTKLNKPYDNQGEWASSGKVIESLLGAWLSDDYYQLAPPKSTGREHFVLDQLITMTSGEERPEDIQRTLCELTAKTIWDALSRHCSDVEELWICGGGAHNHLLMERLTALSERPTHSCEKLGVSPDWVEAVGFAWLAKSCMEGISLNTQSITGASQPCVLGAIHPASN